MVTTRSADKRIAVDGRVEDLALRSRLGDAESSTIISSPTPSGSTIKRRTKITVDIPPPQSAQNEAKSNMVEDASPYATAKESPGSTNDADQLFEKAAEAFEVSGVMNKAEIPDSEASTPTPNKALLGALDQSGKNERGSDDSTPSSVRTRGMKRKAESQSSNTHTANTRSRQTVDESAKQDGNVTGSLDTTVDDPKIEEPATIIPQAVAGHSSDEEGPEVISLKSTSRHTPSKRATKRRKSKQPTASNPVEPIQDEADSSATLSLQSTTESDTTLQPQEDTTITTDTELIPIPTISEPITSTPQTTSKPPNPNTIPTSSPLPFYTPYTKQPILDLETTTPSNLTETPSYQITPRTHNNTANIQTIQSNLHSLSLQPTNLPAKSTNSLEQYRQNKILSRVDKGKGKGKFRLQQEWSGRRRKFVIAG